MRLPSDAECGFIIYLLIPVLFLFLISTALIWQLMRAYTLSILSRLANTGNPIIEKEIVQWVNTRLSDAGKQSQLRNFNDPAIADGKIVIDLIDSIKAGSINYELVRTSGTQEVSSVSISIHFSCSSFSLPCLPQDNLANAKYAISMARKIGARVYALPEDITEVKPKMVMTVFACMMALDYVPNMDSVDQNNHNNSN